MSSEKIKDKIKYQIKENKLRCQRENNKEYKIEPPRINVRFQIETESKINNRNKNKNA